MAQGSFSAEVSAWARETRERTRQVKDASIQRVIEVMQEPGPSRASVSADIASGSGLGKKKKDGSRGVSKRAFGPVVSSGGAGNLPVDTGFLRASLVVSIGTALPELVDTPKEGAVAQWDASSVALKLEGSETADAITAAYTAKYARRVEYGFNGKDKLGRTYAQGARRFVALATQQWPRIVSEVCVEAQSRAASRVVGG